MHELWSLIAQFPRDSFGSPLLHLRDTGPLDHFFPFFGFGDDHRAKGLRRANQGIAAQFDQRLLHAGFGQRCIDLLVQFFDDFLRRVFGRGHAERRAGFMARQGFADGRRVRQVGSWAKADFTSGLGGNDL
jgi:hypothetical protein